MKPALRLPDDPGPNPYDSKTPIYPNPWEVWSKRFSLLAMAVVLGVMAAYKNGTLH